MNTLLTASEVPVATSAVLPQTANDSNAAPLPIGQLAQWSGVSEADLWAMVEYGVLTPTEPEAEPATFDAGYVAKLQRAAAMRQDLALDSHGFALALMFLNQITSLEAQLGSAQRALRDCHRLGAMAHQRG
jgi:hypothetical protein